MKENLEFLAYLRREIAKGLEDERQRREGPWDIEEFRRRASQRMLRRSGTTQRELDERQSMDEER